MNIFVIHKGEDYEHCKKLLMQIREYNPEMQFLMLNDGGAHWFEEAKDKIRKSEFILVCIGEKTHESANVDKEIRYAVKKKKRILVYLFDVKYKINDALYVIDKYMQVKLHRIDSNEERRPVFTEINIDGFKKLALDGYDFYIREEINRTDEPKRIGELIQQYQLYVQTSEAVVNRRQTVSSFYIGVNTAIITAISAIISVLVSLPELINKFLSIGIVLLATGILGLILNANWFFQLDSYGRLNSAKMKVISVIEKQLPANIFDTEWRVMSEKIGAKKYRSFTSIEKTVPFALVAIFVLVTICAVYFLACGLN